MPKVSINLCVFNGDKYLREALDSIVNQTFKDWELVIVNDGSIDSSESIINEYMNQGFPLIYHYQENKGLGYSRNVALTLSQGEYIAFIDQDDLWLPDKLEKQVSLFGSNDEIGFVFSDAIYFSNSNKGIEFKLYGNNYPPIGNIFPDLLKNYFLCLSTVVVNRISLVDIGDGFDDRFKVAEEADLFLRIAYKWKTDCVNEPLVMFRMHSGSSTSLMSNAFPYELEIIYDKLLYMYPNIESKYKPELDTYQYNLQYLYALKDLRANEGKKVRKRITPFLMYNIKFYILYLFSFLPFSFYNFALKLKTKRYTC